MPNPPQDPMTTQEPPAEATKTWHDGPEAIADDWTVPCVFCGDLVRAGDETAVMTATKPGTDQVVARRAWCGKDECWQDVLDGFTETAR